MRDNVVFVRFQTWFFACFFSFFLLLLFLLSFRLCFYSLSGACGSFVSSTSLLLMLLLLGFFNIDIVLNDGMEMWRKRKTRKFSLKQTKTKHNNRKNSISFHHIRHTASGIESSEFHWMIRYFSKKINKNPIIETNTTHYWRVKYPLVIGISLMELWFLSIWTFPWRNASSMRRQTEDCWPNHIKVVDWDRWNEERGEGGSFQLSIECACVSHLGAIEWDGDRPKVNHGENQTQSTRLGSGSAQTKNAYARLIIN